MWICGRSWTTLRFLTPPQCKPKTTLPDASWMKLLDPNVLGTSTNKHKETWSVPTQPMRYRFRLPRECSSATEPFRLGSGSERHVGTTGHRLDSFQLPGGSTYFPLVYYGLVWRNSPELFSGLFFSPCKIALYPNNPGLFGSLGYFGLFWL